MKKSIFSQFKAAVSLCLIALVSLVIGSTIAVATGMPIVPVTGVVFVGSVILHLSGFQRHGMAFMGIDAEVWSKVIVDNLFKDNQFLNHAFNADEYVLGGVVVHIPNAGAKPTVVKNRAVFPATAVKRTDTDTTYALDNYTTDPTHITKREQETIAYDKIADILKDHTDTLGDIIGDAMIYKWSASAAANIIRTTGGAVASHVSGGTGNRKLLLKEDIKKLQTKMNLANIPKQGRILLLDSELLSQLQDDADLKKRDVGMELDMRAGVIFSLYGFKIMERSQAGRYTNDATPVPLDYDAAGAATHNAAGLAWHPGSVERAIGTVHMFERTNDPQFYGDIFSAEVNFGGRIRRSAGVFALVQDASA